MPWSPQWSITYEAPHYASFSNLLSLHLSSVQIFSSALCSQTPSVCFSFNATDEVSHPYRSTGKIIVLYFPVFVFRQQKRRQKILDWTAASITWI
jgi:hypothetical protein